jgi:hypothetical protein
VLIGINPARYRAKLAEKRHKKTGMSPDETTLASLKQQEQIILFE